MSVSIRQREGFIAMPNDHLFDSKLSLEAKGLLSLFYELSQSGIPFNDARVFDLSSSKSGEFISAVIELKDRGYIDFDVKPEDFFAEASLWMKRRREYRE